MRVQRSKWLAVALWIILGLAVVPAEADEAKLILSGLDSPVLVTAPPGDPRLWIVERAGRILISTRGRLRAEPFLDLTARVGDISQLFSERGLLGLAFDPGYRWNGLFYVVFTDTAGAVVVSRFRRSRNPYVADPTSEEPLLVLPQPGNNHNGGTVAFGPDGYLYIGLGDGKARLLPAQSPDPFDHAQNPQVLYGKMLRVDVSGGPGTAWAIPPDNPFVNDPGVHDAIWALGLRNPFRFSFDRWTGDLWIGDVGERNREEIDYEPWESPGGLNWGWDVLEGTRMMFTAGAAPPPYVNAPPFEAPIWEYAHSEGRCSVTGGTVYHGNVEWLRGQYLFGDFCSGEIWGIDRSTSPITVTNYTDQLAPDGDGFPRLVALAEGGCGAVYAVLLGGEVYRIGDRRRCNDDDRGRSRRR